MNVSKLSFFPSGGVRLFLILLAGCTLGSLSARADLVQMINGDRYGGTVVSVLGSNVVFQSDIQGRMVLPRGKVAAIYFQAVQGAAGQASNSSGIATAGDWVKELKHSAVSSNLVEQVRRQLLAEAGPEANRQFDEMVQGLMGGTLSMADIQKQATESVRQLRSAKEDLGEDGEMLDGYLKILEGFLDAYDTAVPSRPGSTESAVKPAQQETPRR